MTNTSSNNGDAASAALLSEFPKPGLGSRRGGAVMAGGRRRLVKGMVLSGILIATIAFVVTGLFWGYYRLEHTVVNDASVKGRVYRIGARIDGQIKSVEVQPGQRVVKDQLLIRLVDDHYQAAARQAQAEVQAATKRRDVEKLAIEQERRRLALDVERCESVCRALTSEVKAAISDRDKWRFERDRIASLLGSGIASVSELDNVTSQRNSAVARVEVAEGNQAAAESNCRLARVQVEGLKVREAGLDVLAAEVELAHQRLSVCEANVAATIIRAPAEGWVADRIIEPGGSAKIGDPMMTLWLGEPWIEAWVDEKHLTRVKVGSPVDVRIRAFANRKLRGRVESIGVLTDKELRASPVPPTLHSFLPERAMVQVRIAVADDGVRLQPGLSAVVGIRDAASAAQPKVALRANDGLRPPQGPTRSDLPPAVENSTQTRDKEN